MKQEKSAMAVVFYQNKILVTIEEIYGVDRISLPKGHIEGNETVIACAMRECFEETNCDLFKEDVICELEPFRIHFVNHKNEEIEKFIYPVVFKIDQAQVLKIKEPRIKKIEWMDIDSFMTNVSYENVKMVVEKAKEVI